MTARRVLLDGLACDADVLELVSELAPLHPRDNTFPGEVFLRAAADALDWCGASRADPLSLEGHTRGGYRAMPAASDRHAARLTFQRVSVLIADSVPVNSRIDGLRAAHRTSGSGSRCRRVVPSSRHA